MLDEIKKSFNEIIYERTTSPFYGTFVVSWMIWNWKILYLTFFVSEAKITTNKLDYIVECYLQISTLVIYPLCSTLIILTLFPFITNGAYWLSLRFNKWRVDQKNKIDEKLLLSIEQSIELRSQIRNMEEKFTKLLENKNTEISNLKDESSIAIKKSRAIEEENENLKRKLDSIEKKSRGLRIIDSKTDLDPEKEELNLLAKRVKSKNEELKQFEFVVRLIQEGYSLRNDSIDVKFLALLESSDIIENTGNKGIYKITTKGKKFLKLML